MQGPRGQDPAHSTTEWDFIQEVYKIRLLHTHTGLLPKKGINLECLKVVAYHDLVAR